MTMVLFGFLIGLMTLRSSSGAIIVGPTNVAVSAPVNATFECTSNVTSLLTIVWYQEDTQIVFGEGVLPGFENKINVLKAENGESIIQVVNVANEDAKEYGCQDSDGIRARAHLILLDGTVTANTTVSTDGIVVDETPIYYECSVGYAGQWAPSITFKDEANNTVAATDESSEGLVKYSVSMTADRTITGKKYRCIAEYRALDPPPGTEVDSTLPTYSQTHDFQHTLDIQYGPEEVMLTPDDDQIHVGISMDCRATSNPAISKYIFTHKVLEDDTDEVVKSGPDNYYIIPNEWNDGQNHTLQCTAENHVGSGAENNTMIARSPVVQFTVYVTTAPSTQATTTPLPTGSTVTALPADGSTDNDGLSGGAIAGIIIAVLLIIIILAIVLYCLFFKNKKSPKAAGLHTDKPDYMHQDRVRTPSLSESKPPLNSQGPPPYNGAGSMPYDNTGYYGTASTMSPYSQSSTLDRHPSDPYAQQQEQLAVDDRPRSRKPIQMMDNSMDFHDITLG